MSVTDKEDASYTPPFKIGDNVYVLTCGMRVKATIADMPYKAQFTNKWLVKVFLTYARSWVVYEVANIVHREREMDKLSSWEVMYNVLGVDIRKA